MFLSFRFYQQSISLFCLECIHAETVSLNIEKVTVENCLNQGFCFCDKTELGKIRDFFSLQVVVHYYILQILHYLGKSGKKLQTESEAEAMEKCSLLVFPSCLVQSFLWHQGLPTCPNLALPTERLILTHQLVSKNAPQANLQARLMGGFSMLKFSLPNVFSWYKVDIKLCIISM